jgi:ATP-dependent helicase/DNAse subunit B
MSRIAGQMMDKIEFARIQSSSSINTYRQCPRKYYYQYILELETKPSIHLIRGKIAHSVLEDFFKINISQISRKNYDFELKIIIHELLDRHWSDSEKLLSNLDLSEEEIGFYLKETKEMVQFWLLDFLQRLNTEMRKLSLSEAFRKLTPVAEEHFVSDSIGVQGYIDAIHKDADNGRVKIIDYKTSKTDQIRDEYRLQLAIYALLYHERYGKYPDNVGLFFLKHGERLLDVDEELLGFARKEVEKVHLATQSTDIAHYPKKESYLCKWSTGQCDFFEKCCEDK